VFLASIPLAAVGAGRLVYNPTVADAAPWRGSSVLAPFRIVPRAAWGRDLAPKGPLEIERREDVRFLLVHHTASTNAYESADVASLIRGFHRLHTGPTRGWPDVAYNFFVDRFGVVWEGRSGSVDRPVKGDATGGSQGFAQLCCFIGDHRTVAPTSAARRAMVSLLAWLGVRYGIALGPGAKTSFVSRGSNRWPAGTRVMTTTIAGHRDMSLTECPGDAAYELVRHDLPGAVAVEAASLRRSGAASRPTARSAGRPASVPPAGRPASTPGVRPMQAVGASDRTRIVGAGLILGVIGLLAGALTRWRWVVPVVGTRTAYDAVFIKHAAPIVGGGPDSGQSRGRVFWTRFLGRQVQLAAVLDGSASAAQAEALAQVAALVRADARFLDEREDLGRYDPEHLVRGMLGRAGERVRERPEAGGRLEQAPNLALVMVANGRVVSAAIGGGTVIADLGTGVPRYCTSPWRQPTGGVGVDVATPITNGFSIDVLPEAKVRGVALYTRLPGAAEGGAAAEVTGSLDHEASGLAGNSPAAGAEFLQAGGRSMPVAVLRRRSS